MDEISLRQEKSDNASAGGGVLDKKDPAQGGGGCAGSKKPFGLQATRRVDLYIAKPGRVMQEKFQMCLRFF
jgi:hypothetical protein